MRKLVALIASIAAFSAAEWVNAATIDLFLTQTAPDSTSWDLTANVNGAVLLGSVAVQIASTSAGSFTIAQPDTIIDPLLPEGFSNYVVGPPMRLGMGPGYPGQGYIVAGSVTGFLIGTWTGVGTPILLPADLGDGVTVTDENFNALAFSLTTGSGPTVEYPLTPPTPIPIPDPNTTIPPTPPITIPDPNTVVSSTPSSPIPEPSSVLLMLVGGAIVASQVRRRV